MEVLSEFVLPVFLSKGWHLPGTLATESEEKIQQTVNKPTSSLQQQNGSLLKFVNIDMFISCRIEKFSVQLQTRNLEAKREKSIILWGYLRPIQTWQPVRELIKLLTQILEAKQESVNLVKEVKFQRASGEDRMKTSCDCWLEAKRWMAKDIETLPSPFSDALNSSLKLFQLPFPSRSQMFAGYISELCVVSHTLGCSWMGLLHQRNFCYFSKNTVQVRVWHQRSSSALHWVQLRGAVPKIIDLCKPRLLFPFADRRKLRGFSPSVRRPLQITAPDIAKVSSRLASRTPHFRN